MLKVKDGINANAATATKLQTSRTINGTSFNGSANITTANWGTARTITIGNTGKSVNGSGNIAWSLSEIGAAASSHNHDGTYMKQSNANGYYGMTANGDTANWVRTTTNGIIPHQSGGASSLGTSSWPFTNIYANNIYDNGVLLENKFAAASHSHNYLALSGGTLSGSITVSGESRFHNGTYSDPASGLSCAIKATGHIAATGSVRTNDWFYSFGNTGWYNGTYDGGWYMTDGSWLRSYNGKSIYAGYGEIRTEGDMRCRYLNSPSGQNLDLQFHSGTGYLNPYTSSGAGIIIGRPWSGSSGTEPCLYNDKGNGWGYIGNTGTTFYRVYGAGGSVSQRERKYEITRADTETQYENIKSINIYNYRTISTSSTTPEELAKKHLTHESFKENNGELTTKKVIFNGIEYDELDESLTQEEIRELRIKEIVEKNPNFGEKKREDLMLGTMVDELPLETTFYDNEGGDGKAVDMYSYTTMIVGATKHLINKVETLEKENEELKNRLNEMEELLNGIINER